MRDEWRRRVLAHQAEPLPPSTRPEAAVLMPLLYGPEPRILLTQRAHSLSTHGGEVAFPGGRRDPEDRTLACTALREAQEEVGLPAHAVDVWGPLSARISKHGLQVTPFVGVVTHDVTLAANPHEIAAIFSVPLAFFCQAPSAYMQRLDPHGQVCFVPSYHYQGFNIWGLTALMMVELVNVLCDAGIDVRRSPVETMSGFERIQHEISLR